MQYTVMQGCVRLRNVLKVFTCVQYCFDTMRPTILSPQLLNFFQEHSSLRASLNPTKTVRRSHRFIANTDLNDFVKANQIAAQS